MKIQVIKTSKFEMNLDSKMTERFWKFEHDMLNFKEASHFSLTLSVEILILGFILMDSTWMVNCSKYMGGQSRRTDRRLGVRHCGDICNVFQALHNCITLHANSDDDRFLAIGFPITSAANFQSCSLLHVSAQP